MDTKLIEEEGVFELRTKGIKNLSLSDFKSLLYSLEFYMEKNVEFDEYIDYLHNEIVRGNV